MLKLGRLGGLFTQKKILGLASFSGNHIRSSSGLRQPISKAEEDTCYTYRDANNEVYWDTENCGIPIHVHPQNIRQNITSALRNVNLCGPVRIKAVGDPNELSPKARSLFASNSIEFEPVISDKKQASDLVIKSKIRSWLNDKPKASNILLLAGDKGYGSVLEQLKRQGHNVLLGQISEGSSWELLTIVKTIWEWKRLAAGGRPLSQKEVSDLIAIKKCKMRLNKISTDGKMTLSVVHEVISVILHVVRVLEKQKTSTTLRNIDQYWIHHGNKKVDFNIERGLATAIKSEMVTKKILNGVEVYVPNKELTYALENLLYSQGMKENVKKAMKPRLRFKKNENFYDWYFEVCKLYMIEHYNITGCYILKPLTISIWEIMQIFFDAEMKKLEVQNCDFPLFVSPGVLERENDHIEGFAREVAWVTKSDKSDLEVPVAIGPTSETVMYPYYSKWIRGPFDLPLKLYQWCNADRWEFSNPTPFIRICEFLWQEGHTAFATKAEAYQEVLKILELYHRLHEEYLAVPAIKGMKSENEKFSGGLYTTSVEVFIPNTGRAVEGATSNCLGENFYSNEKGETANVWQNYWTYSTRTIGLIIMIHGDNKGLILPPKVAPVQVIVIPVPYKDANIQGIYDACTATASALCEAGIRAEEDLRDNYSPGWKYSDWEMKGVPLRIEIGPRDLENDQVRTVRRDNGVKEDIPRGSLVENVKELLEKIQQNMYEVAKQKREACVQEVKTWDEFIKALNEKKFILAPWCDEEEVERDVKTRTKGETGAARTLCSPLDQPELPEGTLCFASGKPAKIWSYWGRRF